MSNKEIYNKIKERIKEEVILNNVLLDNRFNRVKSNMLYFIDKILKEELINIESEVLK